jgi:hypothetical protein
MGKKLLVLLVAVTFVMASCKKDSEKVEKLSANIAGKSWSANLLRVTNLTGNVFTITGTSITGEVIIITIFGDTQNTYEFSLTEQKCALVYKKAGINSSPSDIYTGISGKVIITKVDMINKSISGTFDFTCSGMAIIPISISKGSFNDLEFSVTPM